MIIRISAKAGGNLDNKMTELNNRTNQSQNETIKSVQKEKKVSNTAMTDSWFTVYIELCNFVLRFIHIKFKLQPTSFRMASDLFLILKLVWMELCYAIVTKLHFTSL